MHELANMAASKAQELNLPPPPADFITPLPTPTEKVRRRNAFFMSKYVSQIKFVFILFFA